MVGRCRRPTTLRALPFVQQVAQAIAEYGDSGPELARSRLYVAADKYNKSLVQELLP